MIISKSNIASEAVIDAYPGVAGQDENVVVDNDFSTRYIDTVNATVTIKLTFPTAKTFDYVAVGGSNASEKTYIQIKADGVQVFIDNSMSYNESKTIVFSQTITATIIEVIISGSPGIVVSDIAVGNAYEVPRGEQSGYSRPWSIPNIENRNAVNLQNAPISSVHQSRKLSCTLSVPNNLMSDYDDWYEMLEFSTQNNFYILEDDNHFHSYVCFNAKAGMTKANSQTRSLGSSTLKFDAYSKSNEVFL